MKKPVLSNSLIAAATVLLAALCTWLWFAVMEQVWEPQRRLSSGLAGKPMLAATQLLERRGYQVDVYKLLGDANLDNLPDGTLILADNNGRMSDAQARQLLAWVRRGNTLVAQPRWSGGDDNDDERPAPGAKRKFRLKRLDEEDPLGAHAGVTMAFANDMRDSCDTGIAPPRKHKHPASPDGDDDGDDDEDHADSREFAGEYQFTCVTVPGGSYPLVLETSDEILSSLTPARQALWSDPDAVALRAYEEGGGRLVMVADNFFNNARLPRYDHAQLLLALAAQNTAAKRVFIVQDINATPWYLALWRSGSMALSALAILVLLLLWRAMRRFGPLLPEPSGTRRALLEHIEASGNWLWKAPGGRALLLAAARRETLALLTRRAPELRQLDGNALCARLARLHGIDETALQEALHAEAGAHPAVFVRQIRTLQQVRTSYEHSERQ
ncbi:DUF4350 domain-containing protein [Duganella sp. FT92W]|uniref:DUF4350 domain-containing protein n=1 Tax=Pseudoduganella rivuli TaxID=2666085 RepID=A0A7X2IN91_9BURK|nr:DUF4350 domain-containing protein [Pseudoduganella rivuli]MRV72868.1 DUF4350 domain-containing protein [Pseudoduganella rivuli]